jgi:predicted membrane protein
VGGSVSKLRIWAVKFAFACVMMVLFVFPIMAILVFFVMAVYYVTFVAEDKRRERIEQHYREAVQEREKND